MGASVVSSSWFGVLFLFPQAEKLIKSKHSVNSQTSSFFVFIFYHPF